jgi:hypothetical protein
MVVRNCLANWSSLIFASARRCSSRRRRLGRRAKAASVLVVLRRDGEGGELRSVLNVESCVARVMGAQGWSWAGTSGSSVEL